MEAILTLLTLARVLALTTSGFALKAYTRAWALPLSLFPLLTLLDPMQRDMDAFALSYLLPIALALRAAMRLGRGFVHAGVTSRWVTAAQLVVFGVGVPIHVLAVHGAALDLVVGEAWGRLAVAKGG